MNIDILKLLVVLVAFIYFNLKVKLHINRANFWIMNIGLCLLLFAAVLDFCDGIDSLDNFPILGKEAPWHDILEDQFGDTPGLALFLLGAFREIIQR
jgi:hypothetical protein